MSSSHPAIIVVSGLSVLVDKAKVDQRLFFWGLLFDKGIEGSIQDVTCPITRKEAGTLWLMVNNPETSAEVTFNNDECAKKFLLEYREKYDMQLCHTHDDPGSQGPISQDPDAETTASEQPENTRGTRMSTSPQDIIILSDPKLKFLLDAPKKEQLQVLTRKLYEGNIDGYVKDVKCPASLEDLEQLGVTINTPEMAIMATFSSEECAKDVYTQYRAKYAMVWCGEASTANDATVGSTTSPFSSPLTPPSTASNPPVKPPDSGTYQLPQSQLSSDHPSSSKHTSPAAHPPASDQPSPSDYPSPSSPFSRHSHHSNPSPSITPHFLMRTLPTHRSTNFPSSLSVLHPALVRPSPADIAAVHPPLSPAHPSPSPDHHNPAFDNNPSPLDSHSTQEESSSVTTSTSSSRLSHEESSPTSSTSTEEHLSSDVNATDATDATDAMVNFPLVLVSPLSQDKLQAWLVNELEKRGAPEGSVTGVLTINGPDFGIEEKDCNCYIVTFTNQTSLQARELIQSNRQTAEELSDKLSSQGARPKNVRLLRSYIEEKLGHRKGQLSGSGTKTEGDGLQIKRLETIQDSQDGGGQEEAEEAEDARALQDRAEDVLDGEQDYTGARHGNQGVALRPEKSQISSEFGQGERQAQYRQSGFYVREIKQQPIVCVSFAKATKAIEEIEKRYCVTLFFLFNMIRISGDNEEKLRNAVKRLNEELDDFKETLEVYQSEVIPKDQREEVKKMVRNEEQRIACVFNGTTERVDALGDEGDIFVHQVNDIIYRKGYGIQQQDRQNKMLGAVRRPAPSKPPRPPPPAPSPKTTTPGAVSTKPPSIQQPSTPPPASPLSPSRPAPIKPPKIGHLPTEDATTSRPAQLRTLGIQTLPTPTTPVPALSFKTTTTKKPVHVHVLIHDITCLKVDVIVNAANGLLNHEGGVSAALAKAGGKELVDDCKAHIKYYKQVQVTDHYISKAGKLPCKKVMHVVGPGWPLSQSKKEKDKATQQLRKTFKKCLTAANDAKYCSIAIPPVSAGTQGFPAPYVAEILVESVRDFVRTAPKKLRDIYIVDIMPETVVMLQKQMQQQKVLQSCETFQGDAAWQPPSPIGHAGMM